MHLICFVTIFNSQGKHTIMALFADQKVPNTPITVDVVSSHNAKRVRADGPGIEPDGKQRTQRVTLNL